MQTKRYISFAALWMIIVFGLGNMCLGQSYWKKLFSTDGTGCVFALQPTLDGNFLAAGYTASSGAGFFDGWLIKVKQNGDTLWTKTYGGGSDDCFTAIQPTLDGNFLIAGSTNLKGWLIKIKPNGDTLWTKTYTEGTDDYFTAIQPTADGNFLIAGKTEPNEPGNFDGWLIKVKSNGDTLWTKTDRGAKDDYFEAIRPTPEGNFLIAGSTDSYGGEGTHGWLLKIQSNGDTLWMKTYDGSGWDSFFAIQSASDGNFLIAGSNIKYNATRGEDGLLIKIKPNGDTIWTKTYGGVGFDDFAAIQPTPEGNFLIAGTIASDSIGERYGWLVKIKPNGDILWTKTYTNGIAWSETFFYAIQPTTDGNFLILGSESDSVFTGYEILCVIADQYACKDTRFTYKIPVYSADTLNFGYVPLKVPSGMTVSAGGTVSWTPKTDSVYMDHVEFLVFNDTGKKDTLTFNIFINSDYHPPLAVKPSKVNKPESKPFEISTTALSGKVKLSVSSFVKSLTIYDMSGRMVGKVTPVITGSQAFAVWPGASSSSSAIPTGKYIAKASAGKNTAVKPFLLVR